MHGVFWVRVYWIRGVLYSIVASLCLVRSVNFPAVVLIPTIFPVISHSLGIITKAIAIVSVCLDRKTPSQSSQRLHIGWILILILQLYKSELKRETRQKCSADSYLFLFRPVNVILTKYYSQILSSLWLIPIRSCYPYWQGFSSHFMTCNPAQIFSVIHIYTTELTRDLTIVFFFYSDPENLLQVVLSPLLCTKT